MKVGSTKALNNWGLSSQYATPITVCVLNKFCAMFLEENITNVNILWLKWV